MQQQRPGFPPRSRHVDSFAPAQSVSRPARLSRSFLIGSALRPQARSPETPDRETLDLRSAHQQTFHAQRMEQLRHRLTNVSPEGQTWTADQTRSSAATSTTSLVAGSEASTPTNPGRIAFRQRRVSNFGALLMRNSSSATRNAATGEAGLSNCGGFAGCGRPVVEIAADLKK